jgi:hypothetical protein
LEPSRSASAGNLFPLIANPDGAVSSLLDTSTLAPAMPGWANRQADAPVASGSRKTHTGGRPFGTELLRYVGSCSRIASS